MAIKVTKYDRVIREYLLCSRGPYCERCGKSYSGQNKQGLHVSHYWGRANWAVRLDVDNVVLHCHGCHSYLTGNPHEHTKWKRKSLGTERYNALMRRAKSVKKWYPGEKDQLLDQLRKDINEIKNSNGAFN